MHESAIAELMEQADDKAIVMTNFCHLDCDAEVAIRVESCFCWMAPITPKGLEFLDDVGLLLVPKGCCQRKSRRLF